MADSSEFLSQYRETLAREVAGRWPATWLGNYEFESCLKSSGDKEVFLALDGRNGGHVILRATAADAAERADAEWEVLTHLDHPGIPKAYGSYVENGRSFIAREYFPGVPFDEVVAHHPLTPDETRAVARQLAGILSYIHRQTPPVVHRDIKPQNIIRRPDGSVGLTDFGIARTMKAEASSDTSTLGTLPYAPPEQYGYAQSTPQTDIYALGIVMIYLLTGSPDRRNLAQRVTDPGLRAVIEKCIAFDPADRYSSADQLISALTPRRKRRVIITVVSIVVAVAVLGSAGWLGIRALNAGPPAASVPPPASVVPPAATDVPTTAPTGPATSPTAASSLPAGFPAIPAPPQDVGYLGGGNYPANLSNGGFAVGGDRQVYVATKTEILALHYDASVIRRMPATNARSLNYYNGMLYFRSGDSVIRMDPYSGQATTLFVVPGENLFIDSGKLYYDDGTDGLALYSADLDGGHRQKVDATEKAYYRQLVGGWQFYAQSDNADLTAANLATGETYQLGHLQAHWFAVWDQLLYYPSDNGRTDRLNLSDGTSTPLGPGYQFMVATELGVFGLSDAGSTLDRLWPDGSVSTLVAHPVGMLCVAGGWVFYQDGGLDGPLRMITTEGGRDMPIPS